MINDLREFLDKVREFGECRDVEGADWNIEMGSITEVAGEMARVPMLVFDKVKGYPHGYRVIGNSLASPRRVALALNFPDMTTNDQIVEHWRKKLGENFKNLPPTLVQTGPVKENVITGDKIDLFKFPTPKWHALDGGRYIGTGDVVITRDPDGGWVNMGVFRVQIHDKAKATVYISPGKQTNIIRSKYWAKGKACPVVVLCGQDPFVYIVASLSLPWGVSELEHAGGLRGRPIEVIKGLSTDLPIPASAEIALEGEIVPPEVESVNEGPFGEWPGYYASGTRPEAVFRVKAIFHRNDPIILGCPPVMNFAAIHGGNVRNVAMLWNELDGVVPGVKKVWAFDEAKGMCMTVISIKQMYPGHAKQVALAAVSSRRAAYHGRMIVVVDDDIDASNLHEVLWAMGTRIDPASIDIAHSCWSSPLDPTISPEKRQMGDWTNSRALILAVRPYHWMKEFPPSFKLTPEEKKTVRDKWGNLFKE